MPIFIAAIPFGLVVGAISAHRGLSFESSVFMSSTVFAGASQFAALEFWVHPLPVFTILFSVMAVNFRLVLYSAAVGRRIAHWPAWARYVGFGLLTDPVMAAIEMNRERPVSPAYYFGLALPLYLGWIVETAIGFAFGNLLSKPEAVGLDFLIIAYFIVIVVGFRQRPNAAAIILAAAFVSVATHLTIGPPWHFASGGLAGIAVAAMLAKPARVPA